MINGKFVRRNLIDYHLLLPNQIAKYANPNAIKIKKTFYPTLTFTDAFDTPMDWFGYANVRGEEGKNFQSLEYSDAKGNNYTVDDAEQQVLESYSLMSENYDAPMVAEDGGEWSIGYAHGAEVNMRNPEFTDIKGFSDWEFYPWLSFVYRSVYNFCGVGYQGRYNYDRYNTKLLWTDDYRSTMLLTGHNTAGYDSYDGVDWPDLFIKRHYHFYDFAKETAGDEMVKVEFFDNNIHHQIVSYQDGTKVYVNRGKGVWKVNGHLLGQYGFLFENEDNLIGYYALIDGNKIDYSKSFRGEYLDSYGKVITVNNITTHGAAVRVDNYKRFSNDATSNDSIHITRVIDRKGNITYDVKGKNGIAYCCKLPFDIVPNKEKVYVDDLRIGDNIIFTLQPFSGDLTITIENGDFHIEPEKIYTIKDNGLVRKVKSTTEKKLKTIIEGKNISHKISISKE